MFSDCPSAADEVHDDGDDGEEEQEMNQEAAHMQDDEAAQPEQNQHNSEDEKHDRPSFFVQVARLPRMILVIGTGPLRIRCPVGDCVLEVSLCLCNGVPPLPGGKYAGINDLRVVDVCKNVITKGLSLNLGK
jgi:hypothetical protein